MRQSPIGYRLGYDPAPAGLPGYWVFFAVACMCATAGLALYGEGVSRPILLVEVLVTLSLIYVHLSGGLRLVRLFELPVFVTAQAVLSLGLMPLQGLLAPENLNSRLQGDYDVMMLALLLAILGMLAFWAGCKTMDRPMRSRPTLVTGPAPLKSTMVAAVAVYAIGFASKVYLLQHQLFAYTASLESYRNNLAGAQIFLFGSEFATFGLMLISIEKFAHPSNTFVRWLFWIIAVSEGTWGILSGMKSFLLMDVLVIGAIATLCRRRLAKTWVLSTVFGLILLYPIVNAYRAQIRGSGADQVNTFETAVGALTQALTNFGQSATYGDWIGSGADLTVKRLDALQGVALILSLPNHGAELEGEEELWMIPFYPFVPRIIWPSKPILDKGARFNRLLGGKGDSSNAIPYVADCYTFAGVPGVIAGMFVLGFCIQAFANRVKGAFSKRDVFRYAVIFVWCNSIDMGLFAWWCSVIKTMVIVSVLGWLAYRSEDRRVASVARRAAARPGVEPARQPLGGLAVARQRQSPASL